MASSALFNQALFNQVRFNVLYIKGSGSTKFGLRGFASNRGLSRGTLEFGFSGNVRLRGRGKLTGKTSPIFSDHVHLRALPTSIKGKTSFDFDQRAHLFGTYQFYGKVNVGFDARSLLLGTGHASGRTDVEFTHKAMPNRKRVKSSVSSNFKVRKLKIKYKNSQPSFNTWNGEGKLPYVINKTETTLGLYQKTSGQTGKPYFED